MTSETPSFAQLTDDALIATVKRLAAKLQFTISRETHELHRVQALARHVIPSGDPAAIFERALTLLLQDLERRRCAAVASPRAAREASGRTRHVPASVKREVWRRDDGRCAYVGLAVDQGAAARRGRHSKARRYVC
jgi:hypothetical protein